MLGRKCNLLLPLVLLAGCSHTVPEQGIRVEYVDKPIIVETKCLKASSIPQKPGSLASAGLPSNVERALGVAMAKVSEWARYGNKADVLLKGCAD